MKKNIIYLLAFALFMGSCVRESPLSDVELEDFSLIAPNLKLSRSTNLDKQLSTETEVWLYDRNHNPMQLKNGNLRLNGQAMQLQKGSSMAEEGGISYYDCQAVGETKLGGSYTLDIQLANGETKTISARTPASDINLGTPDAFTPGGGLEITWDASTPYAEMDINLTRHYGDENHSIPFLEVPEADISKGRYTIPADKLNEEPLRSSEDPLPPLSGITIELVGTTANGASIPQGFHENAKVEIVFSETKRINVVAN